MTFQKSTKMHTKGVNISNNLLHLIVSLAINTTAIHLLDRVINSSKIRGMHLILNKTHMPSLSQSQFILHLNNLGIANISLHMAKRHQYSPNSIFISSQLDVNAYKTLARNNKPSMH